MYIGYEFIHIIQHTLTLPYFFLPLHFSLSLQILSYTGEVTHLRGHTGPVNSLVSCKPYSIVVSGSADCTCIIWDTNRLVSYCFCTCKS